MDFIKWQEGILEMDKAKSLFVTGTGTDIGKTYITGLIIKKLNEAGIKSSYYKVAMSGNDRDKDGNLIPGDAYHVKKVSGIEQPLSEMSSYIYENAYSPHLAARIEGNPVNMDVVNNQYQELQHKYEYITLEGSGGITCPITFDNKELYLDDIVKSMNVPTIIIADAGLGTINYVVLTVSYMRQKGIPVKGIILNNYHKGNIMEEDNYKMCEHMTGIKVLATVSEGDTDIDIDLEVLQSLYE